jgi:hypothetical protein
MNDVDMIRRRALAASAGSWQRHGSDIRINGEDAVLFTGRDGTSELRRQADLDAEFVAHARDDVLTLLAILDAGVRDPMPRRAQRRHRVRRVIAALRHGTANA